MIGVNRYFKEWSTQKTCYEIFDRTTGEVVNDKITKYNEANEEVARLNHEMRRAAGLGDEIELPSSYFGTRKATDVPVVAPTIHK